ncbi:60Kd inner membrane protein-domain-containing protein [Tribonema minus]|uniref:60Kd inner membrane protein-domain-containing protein n=1 Tax=Tribonema minus TaxID=303371 RepID=A0A835ZD51_9STRA|nr:60Kd inner membrane protein-domain-containing protein [Tribonema minus]
MLVALLQQLRRRLVAMLVALLLQQRRRLPAAAAAAVDGVTVVEPPPPLHWALDIVVQSVDWVHAATGLPYWGSIVAVTFGVRMALFPAIIFQEGDVQPAEVGAAGEPRHGYFNSEINFKMRLVFVQPCRKAMYDRRRKEMYNRQRAALMASQGTTLWKPLVVPIAQLPLFLCFFFGLQAMGVHCPGFAEGGYDWFMDLSAPDPTKWKLPLLTTVGFVANNELPTGALPRAAPNRPFLRSVGTDAMAMAARQRLVLRVIGIGMPFFASTMPAGVLVYWTASSTFSVLQMQMLNIPFMKRWMKTTPPPPPGDDKESNIFIKVLGAPNIIEGIRWFMRKREEEAHLEAASVLYGDAPPSPTSTLSGPPRPRTFATNPVKAQQQQHQQAARGHKPKPKRR